MKMKMEPFRIEQSESSKQHVMKLFGELDLSVVPQLQGALEHVLGRDDLTLIIDLQSLTYIDSTGIGIFVSILKKRNHLSAPFYVRNIPSNIRRLFDLTGLSGYLMEGTEAEA